MSGRGRTLQPAPGRVMAVPPRATLADFGLGVDLALGRWDIAHERSYAAVGGDSGDRDALDDTTRLRATFGVGERFVYVFDLGDEWRHECVVEGFVDSDVTVGLASIPVPIWGWGTIPDQYGRISETDDDTGGAGDDGAHGDTAESATDWADDYPMATPDPPSAVTRRTLNSRQPLDLAEVREAATSGDVDAVLTSITDRDLAPALQQLGEVLTRVYRDAGVADQARLASALRDLSGQLDLRGWPGDDVLSEEVGALLAGAERRGRTIHVDLENLAEVMANGGEDPGGYLHLDTGEVVHAFLRHGYDDSGLDGSNLGEGDADNLWIYLDHDDAAAWQDMASFATSARPDLVGILSVAIRGKGAVARFRRTIDGLGLTTEWRTFSDDRAYGRARALLRAQGIRPI